MSSSDRYGEARETQKQPLKVAMPRSVPTALRRDSGLESNTDSPIVTNTEVSSPYGEDDHSSPQLRIDTTREVNNESSDFNPLTASLDTGGLGQKYFEEEAYASFGYFDPLAPSPHDADNRFEEDEETYRILNGAPGSEDILGSTEEGHGLDIDLNGPNFGGLFEDAPSLPSILDPTLSQSNEAPQNSSTDAPSSIHPYPDATFTGSGPSFVAGQSLDNTRLPGSSSRYSQGALLSNPNRATETIQGTGLTQQQVSYYNTQAFHQPTSKNARAGRPHAGANVDASGFGPRHLHQFLNPPLGFHKRRSISDASVFLQQEHHNRNSMPPALPNRPSIGDPLQSRIQRGGQTETLDPGFEEQPHAYNYGFPGHNDNEGTPHFDAHYAQTQLAGHEEYPSRGWRHGKQEHYSNSHAQHNATDAGEQFVLYGGTTEILPSQFRPTDIAQARDARVLPQQQVSEGNTMFDSIEDAKSWRQRHLVPSNKNDPTIPRTTAEQKHVVKRMVAAINDTDEAMASTYVKYFTDHKYSPEHIESTCWMALDACITRHLYGPLQTEDERAPFKAKVADYNTCAERIDVVVRAFRTQKSICKQLMEPYHLYQFIDDPLAKIKRTENNKSLNDRKAEQIAAGKALRGDENRSRARRGKQKPHDEDESDNSHNVADALTGLKSASQDLRMASAMSASVRSTPAASGATITRKRKLESDLPSMDSLLQPEATGSPSKRAKTGPASFTKALKPGHGQPQQTYQPHSSGNFADQSHGAAFGQYQLFGQPTASGYGDPSAGGIHGAPYFTQRTNAQRRPGGTYPAIEGYHTPSIGFGLPSTYDEGRTVGHGTVHNQQSTGALPHKTATTNPAISSGFSHPPAYTTSNSNHLSHDSSRGQRKRQAESEEEGSDFESSQAKRKRRRNA